MDATCETPKTCSKCGKTDGEPDPQAHIAGEWVGEDPNAIGEREIQTCTICGEIINSRDVDRGEKKDVCVLEPSGLVMTIDEFADHLISFLPPDCYITNIEHSSDPSVVNSSFDIAGSVDVTVYYDDHEHSFRDNIGFTSDNAADIIYLLEYIIPAVDPDVTGTDLSDSVSLAKQLLNSKTEDVVLLHTGVGYVHYKEGVKTDLFTLPPAYWFYFFTLQEYLG